MHDVPAGQIAIDVSFAGTPIYEEVDDLCSKTTCPIKTGPLDIKYIQDLPPIAPPVSAWLFRLSVPLPACGGMSVLCQQAVAQQAADLGLGDPRICSSVLLL